MTHWGVVGGGDHIYIYIFDCIKSLNNTLIMEDLPTKHGGINHMVIRPGCKHFFLVICKLFVLG